MPHKPPWINLRHLRITSEAAREPFILMTDPLDDVSIDLALTLALGSDYKLGFSPEYIAEIRERYIRDVASYSTNFELQVDQYADNYERYRAALNQQSLCEGNPERP